MKKKYNIVFSFLLFIMCFFTAIQAQDVSLQIVPTNNCDSGQYCVNIQARGNNGADYLGGSSIRLSYDTLAVYFDGYTEYVNGAADITVFQTAGSYTSINFDNDQTTLNPGCSAFNATPYSAHSFDGNITGEILFTIFLDLETIITADGSEIIFACPGIANVWQDVSTVCFDVRDANRGPNFQFVGVQNGPIDQNSIGGTNFNTDSNEPSEKYNNGTLSGLNTAYNLICGANIDGCTDATACNYDPDATNNVGCVYATTWYADTDGDGLGDPNNVVTACTQPLGYVDNNTDTCEGTLDACGVCNGSGPTTWYADTDGDGLGDPNNVVTACTQPAGFVSNNTDTCDNGAIDECGVCGGSGPLTWYADTDGDGLGDPNSVVTACTQPNGYVDNNTDTCEGTIDACGICNGSGPTVWYADNDGDGLGDPNIVVTNCTQPAGFVSNNSDDCDAGVDECGICSGSGPTTWYQDADGDGLGNSEVSQVACTMPDGYVANADDTCDGTTDACGVCNGSGPATWYIDSDGDGLGDPNSSVEACNQPNGYVANNTDDCDGNFDACGICNGPGPSTWYLDNDSDGLGDPNTSVADCTQPMGYVANADDPDDNCDGTADACGVCNGPGPATWYVDNDGDGLGDPNVSVEACVQPSGYVSNSNDTDDSCDGTLDECGVCNGSGAATWYADTDGDGLGDPNASVTNCSQPDGYVANSDDTNDNCNGTLDACGVCNGTGPTTWYQDADGDGLGNPTVSVEDCNQPDGYVANSDDDNDGCSGTIDACGVCNGTGPTTWYYDNDGDGLGDPNNSIDACDQPAGTVSNRDDDNDNSIFGCTDQAACNYDATATDDDGSCILETACDADPCTNGGVYTWDATTCGCILSEVTVEGCTDANSPLYDPLANCDDGTLCQCLPDGCIDPEACNYDSAATCNDGSCIFETTCDTDPCTNGGVFAWDATTCNCELVEATIEGCTDATFLNYNPSTNCDDSSCSNDVYCNDPTACNYNANPPANATVDATTCDFGNTSCTDPCNVILGCTDAQANNYDSTANCDDSSCTYEADCTDMDACNYNPNALATDNTLCDYGDTTCPDPCNVVKGCTDATACNYDATANCDDGSCTNAFPICEDGCNAILGCVDPTACNYDAGATCNFDPVTGEDPCTYDCGIDGCTNPDACNYDMNATDDDGSCIVLDGGEISTTDVTTFCVGDGVADIVNVSTTGSGLAYAYVITDLSAETILGGPTTETALDFEGAPPGTCLIWGLAYDPDNFSAPTNQVDDITGCYAFSNQIAVVRQESGCTNILAENYNPDAVCDDESCLFNEGCIDPTACNYDENADIDDGSCRYEQNYYLDNDGDGLGDPNQVLTICPIPLPTGGFGAPNGYVTNNDDDIDIDQFSVIVEITCNDDDGTLTPVVLVEGLANSEFEYQLCGADPSDWTTFPISGTNVSIQSFDAQADALGFCIVVRLKNDPTVFITRNFLSLSCISTAIELSNFDGQIKGDFNHLTWFTATESDNKYFSLERSLDGVNFTEITKIASLGNNNSIQSYDFNDYDLVNNAYYRLKSTNTIGYSKIASNVIHLSRFANEINLIGLSPIPASDVLNVNINSTEKRNIVVTLLGINGKELISNTFDLSTGTNTLKLDVSTYAAGIYFIQVKSDSKSIIQKIVID